MGNNSLGGSRAAIPMKICKYINRTVAYDSSSGEPEENLPFMIVITQNLNYGIQVGGYVSCNYKDI